MGKSFKQIADPSKSSYRQDSLFPLSPEKAKYNPYPELYRGESANRAVFDDVLQEAAREGLIGADLEFNQYRPTILGIASLRRAVSVRWDEQLAIRVIEVSQKTKANCAGHSVIGAEKYEFEKALNITTPTRMWDCSMVAHHLINGDLTKFSGKEENEESNSLGLMGLWTVASLHTDLPHWKACRGKWCSGPCPSHDVFGYNAVDSWTSVKAFHEQRREMERLNIPHSFYRDRLDLTEICHRMEMTGLCVNIDLIHKMEKESQDAKDRLFPYDLVNNKPVYKQFNPKSRAKVLAYCKENKIPLEETTKGDIAKVLEKLAQKEGYKAENVKELVKVLETAPELSPALDTVFRLYEFKSAGKGAKSWFNEKYLSKDGKLHPRFVTTGASTGRLSSSSPNLQNVPARGWCIKEIKDENGKTVDKINLIKQAIIPNEGMDFLLSDFSQLELRVILYLAGIDPAIIGKDAFVWLAKNSNGKFAKAAAMLNMSERDVAKSLTHGTNYLEGIQVLSPADLVKPNIRAEVEYGARVIYQKKYKPELSRDWDYAGGVVSFTGANLAERLFGDRTLANRKKAIELVEDLYFSQFWAIREWQMKTSEQAEKGYIQSPVGRYLRLYGSPEDNAKMAASFLGQGCGADFVQGVMLRFARERNIIPVLNVHDCLMFEIPKEMSDDKARDFISLMQEETSLFPGLAVPGKAERGPNYGETKPL